MAGYLWRWNGQSAAGGSDLAQDVLRTQRHVDRPVVPRHQGTVVRGLECPPDGVLLRQPIAGMEVILDAVAAAAARVERRAAPPVVRLPRRVGRDEPDVGPPVGRGPHDEPHVGGVRLLHPPAVPRPVRPVRVWPAGVRHRGPRGLPSTCGLLAGEQLPGRLPGRLEGLEHKVFGGVLAPPARPRADVLPDQADEVQAAGGVRRHVPRQAGLPVAAVEEQRVRLVPARGVEVAGGFVPGEGPQRPDLAGPIAAVVAQPVHVPAPLCGLGAHGEFGPVAGPEGLGPREALDAQVPRPVHVPVHLGRPPQRVFLLHGVAGGGGRPCRAKQRQQQQ